MTQPTDSCGPIWVKQPSDYNPQNWGGKSYDQYRSESCKGDQPWDKAFKNKAECVVARMADSLRFSRVFVFVRGSTHVVMS